MKIAKKIFLICIIGMFLVTFTCSLVYLIAQQSLRLGANGLPMQFAVETSIKLRDGQSAGNAVPAEKVDISKSLSTFVMVFDINKNLVATSGMMGSSEPKYPKGVLKYDTQKGGNRVTWQPQEGLRFATVAIRYSNGYIVAARSLSETEKLIEIIGRLVLFAWVACAIFSALALGGIYIFVKKVHMPR